VTPSVLWCRRDLRLRDHPALDAAAQAGPVCALFVLDDVLLKVDEGPRTTYLYRSLRALDEDLRSHGGRLELASTAAEGTTFTVLLPRQSAGRTGTGAA